MQKREFLTLVDKYLEGKISAEEEEILINYYNSFQDNNGWNELLLGNKEIAEAKILEKLRMAIGARQAPIRKMFSWRKIAVAASIILAVGTGSYFLFFNNSGKQNDIVRTTDTVPQDVAAPSVARATLKLDDGTIVYLDSAKNGSLAVQGNVNVVKLSDGQVIYQGTLRQAQGDKVEYNVISNPRGSKVQSLTLIDGTKVWLNAESSITYPTAFVGSERKISITGEAYFEVAPSRTSSLTSGYPEGGGKKRTFLVEANGVTTEVLGTHFNVNSYSDEENIKVTLLEGSVKVSSIQYPESRIIKPGEQAMTMSNGQLAINKNVDVEQVMAWQRGLFEFNETELPVIMRQIARWYDVEIVYEGKPGNEKFGGGISKNLMLSNVLKLLEANGVKFKLEGKRLTVIP